MKYTRTFHRVLTITTFHRHRFEVGHPLKDTHEQVYLSKKFVPQAVGDPPRMNSAKREPGSKWDKKSQRSATYYLTLLQPWWAAKCPSGEDRLFTKPFLENSSVDGNHILFAPNYDEFITFTDRLKQVIAERPASSATNDAETTKLFDNAEYAAAHQAVLFNMAHGLHPSTLENKIQSKFRARAASVWGTAKAKEDGTEPPPGSKPERSGAKHHEGPSAAEAQAANILASVQLANSRTEVASDKHRAFVDHSAAFVATVQHQGAQVRAATSHHQAVLTTAKDLTAIKAKLSELPAAPEEPKVTRGKKKDRRRVPELGLPDISDLNDKQKKALDYATSFMTKPAQAPISAPNTRGRSKLEALPSPVDAGNTSMAGLRMLVHGGPGTGKTFFVDKVLQYARFHNINFIVGANCASAASILPMGETLHSIIGLGIMAENTNKRHKEAKLKPLTPSRLKERQDKYSNAKFIVIDEISMVSVTMLSHISDRFKQIMGSTEDFGGLGIDSFADYPILLHLNSFALR